MGLLLTAASLVLILQAEGSFWDTPAAYLGQTPPTDIPKAFASGLLADPGMFVMGRTAFSSDGKEFYYTQNDSWESADHASMKTIRYANRQWGKPVTLNQRFISPTLSPDGKTLYMRRGNMRNVWQSHRNGDSWSNPTPFLEETYGVYDFMPTASGNAYVGSEAGPDDAKNGITYAYSLLTMSNGSVSVKSLGLPL